MGCAMLIVARHSNAGSVCSLGLKPIISKGADCRSSADGGVHPASGVAAETDDYRHSQSGVPDPVPRLPRIVPSDSYPEVRAHFGFDRIVCSNLANNAAGETSPLVAERRSRRRRFERYRTSSAAAEILLALGATACPTDAAARSDRWLEATASTRNGSVPQATCCGLTELRSRAYRPADHSAWAIAIIGWTPTGSDRRHPLLADAGARRGVAGSLRSFSTSLRPSERPDRPKVPAHERRWFDPAPASADTLARRC
jgi:hypothetical protein